MNDLLLALGQNPRARAIVRAFGLPLPLPVVLRRDAGPWRARPLAEARAVVGAAPGGRLARVIAECLAAGGADPYLASSELLASAFSEPGETFGRPARPLDALADNQRVDALLFDATGVEDTRGLRALYAFCRPLIDRLARCARVVILARTSDGAEPEAAAAQAALDGFMRSVAKEIGCIGATANLVRVGQDADERLAPVLRFLLSAKSAFITAQPIVVSAACSSEARERTTNLESAAGSSEARERTTNLESAAGSSEARERTTNLKAHARALDEPSFVRPLEKKIALVTGAARGIGEATARALAQEGAHVLCVDRPAESGIASQLAREIEGSTLGVDLAEKDAPTAITSALHSLGGVDVVVHNAGITRDKTLARMKPELWDQVLDVNLEAVVRITAAIEPRIRDNGRVVCLSSVSGLAGNVGQAAYAASKAGIAGFVGALAGRLAIRGVTVNAVAPGFIETRMTAAMPVAIREVARRLSALGQGGRPEDVAQAITFLASPGAQGITGRTLRVCGGAFIGA